MNQIECHPYLIQKDMLEFCNAYGIHVTAYSPLGSSSYVELNMDNGMAAGVLDTDVVKNIANGVGKTPAQVVLRWNIQRGVSIIPKSSKLERIIENFSLFDFELTASQVPT